MAVDPSVVTPQVTLNDVVTPIAQQAAQQVVATVTTDIQQRLASVEQQLADTIAAQAPKVGAGVLAAGTAVLHDVQTDPITQRVLVWGIAGAVIVAALAILGFALLGNSTALRWIGAAPAAIGALVLWLSDAGVVRKQVTTKAGA